MHILSILALFLLSLSFVPNSYANYVTIDNDGEALVHVLAETDERTTFTPKRESLDITKLTDTSVQSKQSVSLQKTDNNIEILVSNSQGAHKLHVSSEDSTLVEIEERPETQRLKIGLENGMFTIRQKEFTASTEFPLTVDATNARISAVTETGERYISVLPFEAIESAIRSGVLTEADGNRFSIIEENQELQYKIVGKKVFDILHMYQYDIPVETYVSASNGTILKIDSSTWYRFLNILVG